MQTKGFGFQRTGSRLRHCVSTLAFVAAVIPVPAGAQSWTGASNQDWYNAFNWQPSNVPDGTESVLIDQPASNPVLVSGGTADIEGAQLSVGSSAAAALEIRAGGVLTSGGGLLGGQAGADGRVTIDGSRWISSGSITMASEGSALLEIRNGGLLDSRGGVIGAFAGSSGVVDIDGGRWESDSTVAVGLLGSGEISISGGGSLTAPSVGLGLDDGGAVPSSGSILVTGPGASLSATGLLGIGDAGFGTLRIDLGASVAAGETRLGTGISGVGTLILDGADTTMDAGALSMGLAGRAFVTVSGGASLESGFSIINRISDDPGTGLFTVTGTESRWSIGGRLVVGAEDSGELRAMDGARVVSSAGVDIGNNADANGIVIVDDADWQGSGALRVGVLGDGEMHIRNEATLSAASVTIGNASMQATSAAGELAISGAGSRLTTTGDLRIGETGIGALRVTDGAAVSSGQIYVGMGGGGDGTLVVDGAGSRLDGLALVSGQQGRAFITVSDSGVLTTRSAIIDRTADSDTSGLATVTGTGSRWTIDGITAVGGIQSGRLVISDGGLVESLAGASIGNDAGAQGEVLVTGAGSLWRIRDPAATETMAFSIGSNGTGDLRIENGGRVESNGVLFVSNSAGLSNSITLDGTASELFSGGEMQIGSRGEATLVVANGARLVTNGLTTVATSAGASGAVTLADGAAWQAGGNVVVGNSGAASLEITGGGTAAFGQQFTLGSSASSSGSSLLVDGSESRMTFATEAFFGFDGATEVTISGGGQILAEDLTPQLGPNPFPKRVIIGAGSGAGAQSVNTVTITGEGSRFASAGELLIGSLGAITNVTVSDGAELSSGRNLKLGQGLWSDQVTQSEGNLTVTGIDSRVSTAFLSVGDPGGKGRLEIINGAEVRSTGTTIGNGTAFVGDGETVYSDGFVLVSGEGSRWINTEEGDSFFNGLIGTAAGTGVLQIKDGGSVEAARMQLGHYGTNMYSTPASTTLIIGAAAGEAPAAAGEIVISDAIYFAESEMHSSTLVFNHSDTDYRFDARLAPETATGSATQGVIKHLAGTTHFTADSSAFTGTTELVGGRLLVDGALGGRILVGAGGYLGGSGRVGTAVFGNGSVLAPAEGALGTLNVTGLELGAGSIFEIQVNDQGGSDRVVVTGGGVTIDGAALRIRDAVGGTFTNANTYSYTIIDNDGTDAVNGTFGSITNELAFLTPAVDYTGGSGNDVVLTLNQTSLFPDVAVTRNQIAAAGALQSLLDSGHAGAINVYQAVLTMTESEARRVFDLASGEAHASVQAAIAETGAIFSRSLERRAALTRDFGNRGSWLGVLGHDGRLRADGNAGRVNNSSLGIAGGVDLLSADAGENGSVVVGLAGGYLEGNIDVDARLSRADSKSTMLGSYVSLSSGPLQFAAAFSIGWHEVELDRDIVSGSLDRTARSQRDARTFEFAGTIQYDIPVSASARLSPFVTLRVDNVDLDATHETGAGALNLIVEAANYTDTRVGGGLEFGYAKDALGLNLRAGYETAIGDRYAKQISRLEGASDPFDVYGSDSRGDSFVIGADTAVEISKGIRLGLSYDGRFDEIHRHRGMAYIGFAF